MHKKRNRPVNLEDWERTAIEKGQYFNKEYPITGYQRCDGQAGTILHPACVVEDELRHTRARLQAAFPQVKIARLHVKMPNWLQHDPRLPTAYTFVEMPERLSTTSVTVVMVPKTLIRSAQLRFRFDGHVLPSLKEGLADTNFRGIVGNLGYFMTERLIDDGFPWSHRVRFPLYPIPSVLSYLGFHLFRDAANSAAHGAFLGAHPAAIAKRADGIVEIIPQLEIKRYRVTLAGRRFEINSVNDLHTRDEVAVFTPGLQSAEVDAHRENWQQFAPETPTEDRINLFIANEGNGVIPVERVVSVWQGRSPLPSFGGVLSFERRYFETLFGAADSVRLIGREIQIEPIAGSVFSHYTQILGGLVPALIDGQHIYTVETCSELERQLQRYGNALSPIAECGRESRNFDPRIREPAGVFAETRDSVGWILFDGRHELSIGASVADVACILKKIDRANILPEPMRHAVFVDGGSAMKAYYVCRRDKAIDLHLLNRVAAGSRNGPGKDPDGLNLYSVLQLEL